MPIDTVRKTLLVTYYHFDAIMQRFAYLSTQILTDCCSTENMNELQESLQREIVTSLNTILSASTYYGMKISNDEKVRAYIVGDVIDKMVIAFDDFVLNSQLDDETKLEMITRMHIKSIPMRIAYEEYNPDLKDHLRRNYETEEVDSEPENYSDDEWNII